MLSSLITPLFCAAILLVPVVVYLLAQASYKRASKDQHTSADHEERV